MTLIFLQLIRTPSYPHDKRALVPALAQVLVLSAIGSRWNPKGRAFPLLAIHSLKMVDVFPGIVCLSCQRESGRKSFRLRLPGLVSPHSGGTEMKCFGCTLEARDLQAGAGLLRIFEMASGQNNWLVGVSLFRNDMSILRELNPAEVLVCSQKSESAEPEWFLFLVQSEQMFKSGTSKSGKLSSTCCLMCAFALTQCIGRVDNISAEY